MGRAHLFGHENETSESLQDSVVTKPLQDYRSSLYRNSLTIEVLYDFHPDENLLVLVHAEPQLVLSVSHDSLFIEPKSHICCHIDTSIKHP